MSRNAWPIALAMALSVPAWAADEPTPFKLPDESAVNPVTLADAPADPSVYALPSPTSPDEGINLGGVNLDIKVTYLTDYIYRGVNVGQAFNPGGSPSNANLQFDGTLTWNLGPKLPHPFIGIFANVLENDPISNFQEVRPFFGLDWRIRPIIVAVGHNTYTYPDRGAQDTAEAWGRITLDDSVLLRRDQPLLSPYIYAAYDYDLYNGWYIEAGVKHDFVFEKHGLTITPIADLAYVINDGYFAGPEGEDTGFQHYDIGVTAKYSLNLLLNVSRRYGQWSINGYLFYTDGISSELKADTTVWGGVGIEFAY